MTAEPRRVRRRVLVVWILLAALIATIFVLDRNKGDGGHDDDHASASAPRMLMPAPMEEIAAIEIGHAGTLYRFERDATGTWFYHGVHSAAQAAHDHQSDPVAAQRIETAFSGLSRAQRERQFDLDAQAGLYGLNSPVMIVLVYGKAGSQPLAQYAVGDIAPDRLSRYVLPVGSSYAVTVADYQVENLLNLLASFGVSIAPDQPVAANPR